MKAKFNKKLFVKNLEKNLKNLKINNCKNLFITSDLNSLMKLKMPGNLRLKLIVQTIKKTMGKNYTIYVPTSNLDLIKSKKIFDLKNTKSEMGPLSEYIRNQNSIRSLHPYWSVSGIGAKKNLLRNISPHAYGFKSPWSIMLENDFTQLNIGRHPSKAITLIHHIETIMGVPYRFTKEFNHKIKIGNKLFKKNFYLSVIYKKAKIQRKINRNNHFFQELKKQKKFNYSKNNYGLNMWSFKMKDFFDVSTKYLLNDIYSYLEKKPNLKTVHNN